VKKHTNSGEHLGEKGDGEAELRDRGGLPALADVFVELLISW
jgi:hypothetical protein